MKNRIINTLLMLFVWISLSAQITERELPAEWKNLVYGGSFKDQFLPMPDLGGMTSNTWGTDGVIPRDINNGIEDKQWSYWGGNVRLINDGKYHLFVCRWPESSPKGHGEWPNSEIVHAVADNPFGPYKVINLVGKGHNPEWYITDSGKYVIYFIGGYYVANDINGPWEKKEFEFDSRDRKIIEGLSNLTFAKREDGSFIMICRGGGVWISKDGLSTWHQISDSRVYPAVKGRFEDPLIWKTNIQYHLIVNDWLGRIAWHLRSKDGLHWKTDPGQAYMPGISNYANGTKEKWFKYERIKVLQDEYGRATQANFAVIDTLKKFDRGNDKHNSKNIVIPLTVGKLISILNKNVINENTREIEVLIKAEKGFKPNTDIDFESIRFGAPEEVDFGRGAKVKSVKKDGDNAIVTFYGAGNGITDENFTAKLLGRDTTGKLLFGYSRLPEVSYIEPMLSARKPKIDSTQEKLNITIENFGQVASKESTVNIYLENEEQLIEIGSATITPLQPYAGKAIQIKADKKYLKDDNQKYLIIINRDQKDSTSFKTNQ